jgi:hypothetical protein
VCVYSLESYPLPSAATSIPLANQGITAFNGKVR